MQNRFKLTPMVEGGILAGVSVIMALASMLPILGIVAKILCPLPIIKMCIRDRQKVKEYAAHEKAEVIVVSAKVESEIAELDETDAKDFLAELGLDVYKRQSTRLHMLKGF